MLTLHRLFIKTALVYFLLGIAMGAFLLMNKAWPEVKIPYVFITLHNHILTVGFILMMIMGVAYWMFPRLPFTRVEAMASDALAWASYFLLNSGLILRVVFEPLQSHGFARALLVLSGITQFLGILMFVFAIWKRVYFPRSSAEWKRKFEERKPGKAE